MTDCAQQVWLITGTSSGLGYATARAVLERGGRVVATSRNLSTLEELRQLAPDRVLMLSVDVTKEHEIHAAVAEAQVRFGSVDVLVNNAGYGLVGSIEEASAAEIQKIIDVNLLGQVRLIKAVLPMMRARKSGFIVNLSSMMGVCAIGGTGYYAASKFAVEGMSEALRLEVKDLGIGVMIVEPGPFRTGYARDYLAYAESIIPDYAKSSGRLRASIVASHGLQPGDPARAARAIIAAVESPNPPLRLPLGKLAVEKIRHALLARLQELEAIEAAAINADFPA